MYDANPKDSPPIKKQLLLIHFFMTATRAHFPAEIQELCGVSQAAFYRYINFMKDIGFTFEIKGDYPNTNARSYKLIDYQACPCCGQPKPSNEPGDGHENCEHQWDRNPVTEGFVCLRCGLEIRNKRPHIWKRRAR